MFAIFHAFELQPVGIQEEDGVVILVILTCRIDDGDAFLLQEGLQIVNILPAPQLEGVVVKADIADAMRVLLAFGVRLADPETGLAVGPPIVSP